MGKCRPPRNKVSLQKLSKDVIFIESEHFCQMLWILKVKFWLILLMATHQIWLNHMILVAATLNTGITQKPMESPKNARNEPKFPGMSQKFTGMTQNHPNDSITYWNDPK